MSGKKKNWIKKAIKHPGALREKAERAGAVHGGKIDQSWLKSKASGGDKTTAAQARMAIALGHMKGGK